MQNVSQQQQQPQLVPVPPSLLPAIDALSGVETLALKMIAFPIRIAGLSLMVGGSFLLFKVLLTKDTLGLNLLVKELINSGAPMVIMAGASLLHFGRVLHTPSEAGLGGLGLATYPALLALGWNALPMGSSSNNPLTNPAIL